MLIREFLNEPPEGMDIFSLPELFNIRSNSLRIFVLYPVDLENETIKALHFRRRAFFFFSMFGGNTVNSLLTDSSIRRTPL